MYFFETTIARYDDRLDEDTEHAVEVEFVIHPGQPQTWGRYGGDPRIDPEVEILSVKDLATGEEFGESEEECKALIKEVWERKA